MISFTTTLYTWLHNFALGATEKIERTKKTVQNRKAFHIIDQITARLTVTIVNLAFPNLYWNSLEIKKTISLSSIMIGNILVFIHNRLNLRIQLIGNFSTGGSLEITPTIFLVKSCNGIEFLPQTQIFWSQYLCNLMVQTFNISNLDYFIHKY